MQGFSSKIAVQATHASFRQITYWAVTGILTPSLADGIRRYPRGGGERRRYAFTDLIGLRAIADLRRAGVSLQAVRKVGELIRDFGQSFSDTFIVVQGTDVLVSTSDAMISVLRQPGQIVMEAVVYDLGRCEMEVAAALAA